MRAVSDARDRVRASISGLFAHGDPPLADTAEYAGDPGLCGPDSVSWRIMGDVSVFVGAIRALLAQAAHPEAAAGVNEHSRYRQDPMGRLNRTAFYVTSVTYGAMPEVHAAVDMVRTAHQGVAGQSHRGRAYSASMPGLAAWVHNTLIESFLVGYEEFGPPLSAADADRFVAEQSTVGSMLGASPLPLTAPELKSWVRAHPEAGPSPGMHAAIEFLRQPPMTGTQGRGYQMLFQGAVSTLPSELAEVLGVRARPGSRVAAAALVRTLRVIMRNSPSRRAAMDRCGIPYDPSMFRDPL